MPTVVRFFEVGHGNMTLIEADSGEAILCDCNITDENHDRVLAELVTALGGRPISTFINSHRDADHLRGIAEINEVVGIGHVVDAGVPGGTPSCGEYEAYMRVRRTVGFTETGAGAVVRLGRTTIRVLSGKDDTLPNDPHMQSVVLKIEHVSPLVVRSTVLTGDSEPALWRDRILPGNLPAGLVTNVLLASHHGSKTFFDARSPLEVLLGRSAQGPYLDHLSALMPNLTVISVGANPHGLPHWEAQRLYEAGTVGAPAGERTKVYRSDLRGTLRLDLRDDGGWWLTPSRRSLTIADLIGR